MKKLFCAAVLAVTPLLSHADSLVSVEDFNLHFNLLNDNMDNSYPTMKITEAKGVQTAKLIKGQTITVNKSNGWIDKITLKCPNATRYSEQCGESAVMLSFSINLETDAEGLMDEVAATMGYLEGEFYDQGVLTKWNINPKADNVIMTYTAE